MRDLNVNNWLQDNLHIKNQSLQKSPLRSRIRVHGIDTNKDLLIIPEYGMMEYPQNHSKGGLYEILQQAAQVLLWS